MRHWGRRTATVQLVITTPSELPEYTLGSGDCPSVQIETVGGRMDTTVTYRLASGTLPPGMSLSEYGVLSGTPTTHGEYLFLLEAIDGP